MSFFSLQTTSKIASGICYDRTLPAEWQGINSRRRRLEHYFPARNAANRWRVSSTYLNVAPVWRKRSMAD